MDPGIVVDPNVARRLRLKPRVSRTRANGLGRNKMMWWGWLILGAAGLVGLYLFLGSQARGRNLSRYEFQKDIRALLILRENGGYLNIKHRMSSRFLRVYREGGDGADAVVMVRIPVQREDDDAEGRVRAMLDNQGLTYTNEVSPMTALAIPVPIPDVWAPEAGAPAARVAHLVFDSWGVAPDDRFDLRLEGRGRWRSLRESRLTTG